MEMTTGGIIIIPIDIKDEATMKSTMIKGIKIRKPI
jgi:hypothetical protein